MLAKIAAMIALLLTALAAPVVNPQPDPAGYPEPATTEPAPVFSVGDAPTAEQPTATPVTLPTPAGHQCVKVVYVGNIRTCGEWGPAAPILPTPTAAPQEGYPLP